MATPSFFLPVCIYSPVHMPTGLYMDMNTTLYDHWILRLAFDTFYQDCDWNWPTLCSLLTFSWVSSLAFICSVFPAPLSFSSHVQKVVTVIILSLCISPSVYKPTISPKWACICPGLAYEILRYGSTVHHCGPCDWPDIGLRRLDGPAVGRPSNNDDFSFSSHEDDLFPLFMYYHIWTCWNDHIWPYFVTLMVSQERFFHIRKC